MRNKSKSVTLRLPEITTLRMRGHDGINWSKVMRDLIEQRLDELDNGIWKNPKGEVGE